MISVINSIIAGLGAILRGILSILPDSPFNAMQNIDNDILALINYALPVNQAVAHLAIFTTAVGTWYGLRIVMRWIKAAGA